MVEVKNLQGNAIEEIHVPKQFSESIRVDLIRRAVHALQTKRLQPKGVFKLAGMQTSAEYFGRRHRTRASINIGRARLPREKLASLRLGRVRIVPQSVKGRRAHPPKPEKKIVEKINAKENRKAVRSAIAATASKEAVAKRGHLFQGELPLVVNSSFESIKKASEAKSVLEKLGLAMDLQRSSETRSKRGKRRKGHRTRKSVLIVYASDEGVAKAVRNLPGVDAARVDELNTELLAPGGVPGRLALWTKNALLALQEKNLYA